MITRVLAALWRGATLSFYAATTLAAVSEPTCRAWSPHVSIWTEDLSCPDLAAYEVGAMLAFVGFMLLCALIVLPFSWREAVSEIGNVSETAATRGLRRAIVIRDFWRATCRESFVLGWIVFLIAVGDGAVAGGLDVSQPWTLPFAAWNPHLKLLGASAVVLLAGFALQPKFDVVPHVTRWLRRRTYMTSER